tara:strand:+ start:80 stop:1216 length:1137 start_codon:yes stop_codon:yes gene_type:complete
MKTLLLTFLCIPIIGFISCQIDSTADDLQGVTEEVKQNGLEPKEYIEESTNYTCTASSYIPKSVGLSYNCENVNDGNLNTWWTPSSKTKKEIWLKCGFQIETKLKSIKIHAGAHHEDYSFAGKNYGNLYFKNFRIKRLRVEFSDGSFEILDLKDIDAIQILQLKEAKNTTFVKLTPLDHYDHNGGWDDFCISELEFLSIKLLDGSDNNTRDKEVTQETSNEETDSIKAYSNINSFVSTFYSSLELSDEENQRQYQEGGVKFDLEKFYSLIGENANYSKKRVDNLSDENYHDRYSIELISIEEIKIVNDEIIVRTKVKYAGYEMGTFYNEERLILQDNKGLLKLMSWLDIDLYKMETSGYEHMESFTKEDFYKWLGSNN